MTYNEWRDELKGYLLSVSESERKRVLDYYAEAYADRREAGFSEREIIAGFGAPYDAAQRVLGRDTDDGFFDEPTARSATSPTPPAQKNPPDRWLFVLVCVLLAPTLVGVFGGLLGLAVALVAAPFGILFEGIGGIIGGFMAAFRGDAVLSVASFGVGLFLLGIAIAVTVLSVTIVKKLWVLIPKAYRYLKDKFLAWRDGK